MAISFSQTTRILQADQSRFSLLALGFLIIMLLIWSLWFFTASVNNYVSSETVRPVKDPQPVWEIPEAERRPVAFVHYRISAVFDKDLHKIDLGQPVRISMQSESLIPAQALKSTVTDIDKVNKTVTADLLFQGDDNDPFRYSRPVRFDVSVKQETPAAFLFNMVAAKRQPTAQQSSFE